MASYVYMAQFVVSVVLIKLYLDLFSKQHGIHYISFLIISSFSNLSYWMISVATNAEAALVAQKVIYSGSLFLPLVLISLACDVCKINKRKIQAVVCIVSFLFVMAVITTDYTGLFYRSVSFTSEGQFVKEYGIVHTLYYAYLFFAFSFTLVLLVMNKEKSSISYGCYGYVLAIDITLLCSMALTKVFGSAFYFDSTGMLVVGVVMLLLCRTIPLYDLDSVIYEDMEHSSEMGIITMDQNMRLYGVNSAIREFMPEFCSYSLDTPIPSDFIFLNELKSMASACDNTGLRQNTVLEYGDNFYMFNMENLSMGGRSYGYRVIVTDVTLRQKYVQLMESFKKKLEAEVESQTNQIVSMQNSIVRSMAELVESRDNSTGGHVKRTSEIMVMLAEEVRKCGQFDRSDEFYSNLVKAAPLHDLGKIAVDDSILRKPGRFTPEEFAQMKKHAEKGGDMVRKVLENVNDPDFVAVAINVAHYHHERWDGTGYPTGLSHENIPFEARIMAIADVYDALVSKRCYKETFDFNTAYDIIMDGMGGQFDPKLKSCFVNVVPSWVTYYRNQTEA